jgi:hypothetical protein
MLFYGTLTVGKALCLSAGDDALSLITFFATILLGLKMLMDDWTKREFLIALVFAALTGVIFLFSRRTGIIILSLTLMGAKNIDIDVALRFTFAVRLAIFVGYAVAYVTKITTPALFIDMRMGKFVEKHDFGFGTNPNQVSVLIFTLCALYLYCRANRRNIIDYICAAGACLTVYSGTKSRSLLLAMAFLIATLIIFKCRPAKKLARKLAPALFLVINVGACVAAVIYMTFGALMSGVNALLQNRITLAADALKIFGLTLLGRQMPSDEFVVDIAYVHSLIQYGLIFYVWFIYEQFRSVKALFKTKNVDAAALMLAFAVYGIGEEFIYNPIMNVSLLFVGKNMYDRLKRISDKGL